MAKQTADEFLAHHGVLGMKWGHHTARTSDNSGSNTTKVKQPSRRAQVKAAVNYKLTNAPFEDIRSSKSVKLGRAAATTSLASIGSYLVGRLSSDPRVRAGANAATIVLAGTSLGFTASEHHSQSNDLIKYQKDNSK